MHASLMDARSGQLMRALSLVEHGVEVLRGSRGAEKREEEAEMVSLDLCGVAPKDEEEEEEEEGYRRLLLIRGRLRFLNGVVYGSGSDVLSSSDGWTLESFSAMDGRQRLENLLRGATTDSIVSILRTHVSFFSYFLFILRIYSLSDDDSLALLYFSSSDTTTNGIKS